MRVAEKWDGRMPQVGEAGGDWKHRARRAEAERGAALGAGITTQLETAGARAASQRDLRAAVESKGWRLTAPLRRAGAWAGGCRRRRSASRPSSAAQLGLAEVAASPGISAARRRAS